MRFPPPESEWWRVRFSDGSATTFTPSLRLTSNQDHPAVRAGYDIMAGVAREMTQLVSEQGVRIVFTVIPTKELVYWSRVEQAGLDQPPEYRELVAREQANVAVLAAAIRELEGPLYVDLIAPLQTAARSAEALYPTNMNGHPLAPGYKQIAQSLGPAVDEIRRMELTASDTFNLAFEYQQTGRRAEAIALYEQLLELEPRHDQGAFNLAFELIKVGSPEALDRAVSLLEPLAERRPDYTEVLYRLGEAESLRGATSRAAEWYRRFLEVGGHPDLVRKASQRLKVEGLGDSKQ